MKKNEQVYYSYFAAAEGRNCGANRAPRNAPNLDLSWTVPPKATRMKAEEGSPTLDWPLPTSDNGRRGGPAQ
jgi:hypothetical protein